VLPLSVELSERRPILLIAAIAALQSIALLVVSFATTGNHFMFPLDDAYIHLQYARSMTSDDFLVYTQGSAPSGGMTSPLYVMMLAPVFLLGVSGTKAAFASYLLGAGFWALTNVWVYQIARRLMGDPAALVATVLMLTNGHLLWHFHSGMETGMVAAMFVGIAGAALAWWQTERPAARLLLLALLALLPLARPEAGSAIPALALVVLLRKGERPRLSLIAILLCAVPFLCWLAILHLATGDWRPAGMIVKGLGGAPVAGPMEKLAFAAGTLQAIFFRYLMNVVPDENWAAFVGTDSLPYFAPGLGLLILAGFGLQLAGETRGGRPGAGMLIALMWLGSLAAVCTGLFPFSHHQRYLATVGPLGILLAAGALRKLSQVFQQQENTVRRAITVGLVLAGMPSLLWWAGEHGRNGRDLYNLLREATFRFEPDARPVAITDAGILAYYSNRQTVDLVGLTTAHFAPSTLHGPGATLEAMSRLPHSSRPAELITYRPWFDADFPIGEPRWSVTNPRTTSAWGNVLGVYPIDWDAIDSGDLPAVLGRPVLLTVDVADLQSEAAAGYEPIYRPADLGRELLATHLGPSVRFENAPTTSTLSLTVVDGGRTVRGERLTFASSAVSLEAPLELVGRLAPPRGIEAPQPSVLRVRIISGTTGYTTERLVAFDSSAPFTAHWPLGPVLREVGGVAPDGTARWTIEILPHHPPDAAWTSCHWWMVQSPADE